MQEVEKSTIFIVSDNKAAFVPWLDEALQREDFH